MFNIIINILAILGYTSASLVIGSLVIGLVSKNNFWFKVMIISLLKLVLLAIIVALACTIL